MKALTRSTAVWSSSKDEYKRRSGQLRYDFKQVQSAKRNRIFSEKTRFLLYDFLA